MLDQPPVDPTLQLTDAAAAELMAQFAPVPVGPSDGPSDLEAVGELDVEVVVELGRSTMTIAELLCLNVGSVVGVGTLVGAPLLIRVNGHPVWSGEPLAVDDQLAVRVGGVAGDLDPADPPA